MKKITNVKQTFIINVGIFRMVCKLHLFAVRAHSKSQFVRAAIS